MVPKSGVTTWDVHGISTYHPQLVSLPRLQVDAWTLPEKKEKKGQVGLEVVAFFVGCMVKVNKRRKWKILVYFGI